MRWVLALAALALAGCSVTVKGVVRDKITQAPVAGAVVTIENAGTSTTNDDGTFSLKVSRSGDPVTVAVRSGAHYPWSEFRRFTKDQGDPILVTIDLISQDDVVRRRERFESGQNRGASSVNVTTANVTPTAGAPAAAPVASFCTNCGAKLGDGAFCAGCGTHK